MADKLKQKLNGVLLMRGGVIDLCIPSFSPLVYSFQLIPAIYSEMEITDSDTAAKQFADFVLVNKIPPSDYVLVMQTPLFRKEFPLAPQEKLEAIINQYIDYIPFDNVFSKRIKTDKGVMIVAANGDLILSINKIVSQASSSIKYTVALEGITQFPKGGLNILTQASAQTILNNDSLLRNEAFSLTPQRSMEGFEIVEEESEKKEKSNLPLLLGVFVILLIVLGYVYFSTLAPVRAPVAPKAPVKRTL
jgi:hypothetical protein